MRYFTPSRSSGLETRRAVQSISRMYSTSSREHSSGLGGQGAKVSEQKPSDPSPGSLSALGRKRVIRPGQGPPSCAAGSSGSGRMRNSESVDVLWR